MSRPPSGPVHSTSQRLDATEPPGNPLHLHHRRRRLRTREGHRSGVSRPAAGRARALRDDPEVRPVHQRRPGDDEPVPARRGVRHRGRRGDGPRPRALRALHRHEHEPRLQRHRRRDLQLGDPARAPRRLPRRNRPGDPAHHRRDQEPDQARRRVERRGHRHHGDRRHGRRHRVAAVPRGAPPVPLRGRPRPLHVRAPHAGAVPRQRRRAEDEAHSALRAGAAPHRHPAGHGDVPLGGAPRQRNPREDRAVREPAGELGGVGPRRRLHLQGPARVRARGRGRGGAEAFRDRAPAARPHRLGGARRARRVGNRPGPHRPGGQVQPARGRVHVRHRGAQPRRLAPRRARGGRVGRQRAAHRRRGRRGARHLRRHPRARRIRRAGDRGQDPGGALRARERGALPRHLPRDADRGRRVRAARGWDGRRELDRVRPRDALPGDRPPARAEGGPRHGRHDAARRGPGEAARRHARPRDLRRRRHLRAPPPPLRGEQPPAQAPGARRPRVQRHVARRPPGRGHRATRPSLLRGVPVPPRVQVAPAAPAAAVPRLRGRGPRAGPQARHRRARARGRARGPGRVRAPRVA